ncbi:DUF4424 domain-containing protein [Rhizobium sp. FY34]|uniref:DUF4424 domain-containing protein n=1 Tax=Rhizobium sp. FY34 TaxID=2562309 RepID=UPI0010C10BFC|nr:DUF4424 domain-containing protein [Rhizobium sp. FY34]
MTRTALYVFTLCAFAAPALANDTMAELKTGGLVYVETSDVAMEQEDLYLSMTEVRVDYVFRNTSDKDVDSVIAFPMPDIQGSPDGMIAIPDMEVDNFLGFAVQQDGKTIQPALDQRVTALGVDRTEELRKANVPLLPYSDATASAITQLSPDMVQDWIAKGLLFADTYDAGKGWTTDYRPLWTLHSAYWWKTRFAAGKPVRVSHRYKPSVGATVAMSFISEGKPGYSYGEYRQRFCLDDAFMKTAAKLEKAAASGGPNYTEAWISYVLKTGANWGGSIGRFTLTIDKGDPKNFVSFCGEGVKKTGPTSFVLEKQDFTPEKDLDVLFLVANPAN